eukprot:gnl/Dysnectes_brevis/920_a1021_3944.p1 GENE.gnl/Dysnectes_brevis/920_a1021_3944~~gnl/Dysnectes_brevis/920_a1021_3944.p1  ORF type:complete len:727 (+),score=67.13 gnl/Dysnectes_brevis/920_a1021_3944:125-2305(+)
MTETKAISSSKTIESICKTPLVTLGIQHSTPVAFSGDSKQFAFISGSHSITLCSAGSTIQVTKTLIGHTQNVHALAFHPKLLNILASASEEGVTLWDVSRGKIITNLSEGGDSGHESAVFALQWIFGGRVLVTGGKDSYIKFWDFNDGKFHHIETLSGHKSSVLSLSVYIGGEGTPMLASCSRDATIRVWDIHSVSEAGLTARQTDGSLHVRALHQLEGHRGDVLVARFTHDGKLLFTGARDNTIRVWDTLSGHEVRTLPAHDADVTQIVFMNRSTLMLSFSSTGIMKVWTVPKYTPSPVSQSSLVTAEALLAIETTVEEEAVAELDQMVARVQLHDLDICSAVISPHIPLMVTASEHNCVRIWNIQNMTTPQLVQEFMGHTEAVRDVRFLDPRTVVSASDDCQVALFNVATLRRECSWTQLASASALCLSNDKTLLFVGGVDYVIRVYCIDRTSTMFGRQIMSLNGHAGKINVIEVCPQSGFLYSAGQDFNMRVWRLPATLPVLSPDDPPVTIYPAELLEIHSGPITAATFHTSGDYLATVATDHQLCVWKVNHRKGRISKAWQRHQCHDNVVTALSFGLGPTADHLISASWDHTIKIWKRDQPRRGQPQPIEAVNLFSGIGRVVSLAVTPDGSQLLIGAMSGHVVSWQLSAPFRPLVMFDGTADGGICAISLSPDGLSFVTGSEKGTIQLWPLNKPELFAPPSEKEQQQFLIPSVEDSYQAVIV